MVDTTSIVILFDICQEITNQEPLTRVQLDQLNRSSLGKAILARWHVQNENFSVAAQKFLTAYKETGESSLLFEAAYSLLMWAKKLYQSEFNLISNKTKQTVHKNERQALALLIDAANGGHRQAAACVLHVYLTSEQKVQINRKILFLALAAANDGFLDGRTVVPQISLLFSLVPRSDELKMIDRATFIETCCVIYEMSCNQLIELNESEEKILTRSFAGSPLLALVNLDPDKREKLLSKLFKVFF